MHYKSEVKAMAKIIVEKTDPVCLALYMKAGKFIKDLPIINSCIIDIDEKKLGELKCKNCKINISEEACVTAQINRAKEKVSYLNTEGLTGRNITAAVLDTGISPLPDFGGRIRAFEDIIGGRDHPYDDNSHGTHVSGILGGSGKLRGMAPNINIVSVKVLDKYGRGSSADLLGGLQWVYENKKKYNIRIVNLSVGTGVSEIFDPLVSAVEALWDDGIVVTTAAGNNGPDPGSVTSPGTSRKVITVGCLDDDKKCSIWDTEIKNFSGRGPTRECIVKPDILAPGAFIYSCSNTGAYIPLSGTSMSTPIVTGAVALLMEKYPDITPNQIKYLLKITCDDLNMPVNRQGWGLLNVEKLLHTKPIKI